METSINQNSILSVFKWPLLGVYTTCKFFFTFFFDILKFFYKGIFFIFVRSIYSLFQTSSSNVDRAYKKTKIVVRESKTSSLLQKDISEIFENFWFVKAQHAKYEEQKRVFQKLLLSEDAKRVDTPQVYKYLVKTKKGKFETGTFVGVSILDVNAFLVNEGYEVYNIETSKSINFLYGRSSSVFAYKMASKDLIFWLSQMATYLKSGITLVDSVRILSKQMSKKDKKKKRTFDSIVYELTLGESFSKALEKQGTVFPQLLINMLQAAEATGDIIGTLDDMVSYYTEIDNTKKQMVSAITYPAILMVFAFVVVGFIMLYVIPQFVEIYESSGIEITGLTAVVINSANFLKSNIILIIGLAGLLIVVLFIFYKQLKAFKVIVQSILMRLPIVGNVIIYNELTIFTKTFSSLLRNNVFITESMDLLSKITTNEIYKEIMFETINNIAKGDKISDAFHDHWAVPDIAYYMIVTGESTGELANTMARVSEYYQGQHRAIVTSLKSFIEPVMIISLALIVGIVILAVIVPMFDLYGTIQM